MTFMSSFLLEENKRWDFDHMVKEMNGGHE
uniref:Uncharacterized protein n=1 Tax=Rhizophora mucronata TaxID=61149 RepID=A0A2P2PPS0_RHIMU